MSVLDLQTMKVDRAKKGTAPSGSRTSKGCGNTTQSNVSLIICVLVL